MASAVARSFASFSSGVSASSAVSRFAIAMALPRASESVFARTRAE